MAAVKRILIAGAGIAGPVLAWWLHHHGFTPVLVEKSPGPRPGGHAIDARGVALRVLKAMGLAEEAEAKRTRMKGVSEHDADGEELWRSEEFTITGGSFGLEAIEIMRDELANILEQGLPENVEIIYGDSVAAYEEREDGVEVLFASGAERAFDLVVGADGLTSSLRRMHLGPDSEFLRPFHFAIAPFSAPNSIGLEDWQLTFRDGEASCTIYTAPGNHALRVNFGFQVPFEDVPATREEQVAMVKARCGHMRWHAPVLFEAMEHAPDFYLGAVAQVKMESWSRGRITLAGDAGYSPSPYTGQGTSLALVGAYVLAWELSLSPDDHAAAFARTEAKMRPFVAKNQAIADLTMAGDINDPDYYLGTIEPAMEEAKDAIELEGLD